MVYTLSMAADLILLITALIWGFAFVAQRTGMSYMGPFTFNAVRFLVGSLTLFSVAMIFKEKLLQPIKTQKGSWRGALLTGLVLFAAASLQQAGLVGTTAGKAGFITGLYVVFVPILGLLVGKLTSWFNWAGAILAVIGLFFLSIRMDLTIASSDLIVLIGAVIWAVHVHLIGYYSPRIGAVRLAITQFMVCGVLSFFSALLIESPSIVEIRNGWIPLAYGAFLSVGLAYTLQVVAQQKADPSHAAIILSLESLFAAIGGWWILGERLDARGMLGASLMLAGMLISQMSKPLKARTRIKNSPKI